MPNRPIFKGNRLLWQPIVSRYSGSIAMAELEEMVGRVESLVAAKDWAALAELDDEVRRCVDEAVADAGELGQERVRAGVERLQALYDQARESSEKERDEAAEALRANNRTQKAAKAYLDNQ
ncbi:hypothetical protein CK501_07710 [Halovibrio salipaludis]|uniref:Flagellar protein FliT n=2 Tax=Halovibrio salipaludis TaxID=2032626 RepID=A0A2A2F780_9GAMM|nr:hypothetical protein CK501_07710 [Halovibrio salipaludis]